MTPKKKLPLATLLRNNPKAAAEFKSKAQPAVSTAELYAWLSAHPQFSQTTFAMRALSTIRYRLGCPAKQGGDRGGSRSVFLRVAHTGTVTQGERREPRVSTHVGV